MAENPLLPHRKLQQLYTLIARCRTLEKKRGTAAGRENKPAGREAILAATAIHLEPGDLLSASIGDPAAELAPASTSAHTLAEGFTSSTPRLLALAATVRGLQLAGSASIAVALASAQLGESGWQEAFAWAQADRLPLIFCFVDAPAQRSRQAQRSKKAQRIDWPELDRVCRRLHLPTLIVDGEDAVAVFRVMQEAALRARTTLGPSVIWASIAPEGVPRSPGATPIVRLRRYMAARDIPLPR